MAKLLTIFGISGQQGGSLADHILNHPELSQIYKIRGVTRDPSKPAAVAMRERGVEIVQADMSDSIALKHAVTGSYAVFAMTNFWDKASADVEIAQGKAIADASVAAGVSVLIWSTLPNVTKMTDGKLSGVKHFDSKAKVEDHIRTLPITSIFYMPAFYMQNFTTMFKPKPDANGNLILVQTWSLTTHIPLIDITDTGKFLTPALLNPQKYSTKTFTAATAYYTQADMIAAWTKVTGKKITFVQIPDGTTKGNLSPEMVRSLRESGGLMRDYEYFGAGGREAVEWTVGEMEEGPRGWEEFFRGNGNWFGEG